jgi:effector-binding domain-containing protein
MFSAVPPDEVRMRLPVHAAFLVLVTTTVVSCGSPAVRHESVPLESPTPVRYELPIARAPFRDVSANYKERLDQPYVYVEVRGPYGAAGRELPSLFQRARDLGLEPSGAPFVLLYGDPNAGGDLVARACLPIDEEPTRAGLPYDVLPSATVAYAYVGGAYPEVSKSYSGILAYCSRMGWQGVTPVRETYLVSPAGVTSFDELVCEVQIPVSDAR